MTASGESGGDTERKGHPEVSLKSLVGVDLY